MTTLRLRPITAYELQHALGILNVDPIAALRDPVRAMRLAASADLDLATRFLRAVAPPGAAIDLGAFESEDEALLFTAAVLARLLVHARQLQARQRRNVDPE